MQIKLELLAPAKNKDIGIAAINCGADAVYIAGPSFGAREAAGNPLSEIEELTVYAHRYGAGVYMTLNTILFDNELEKASKLIWGAYNAGCDAIIIQDLGILKMDLPPINLYASTQTNIRTPEQARFLESLGFKRLILARELSTAQIKAIKEATSCELEFFIHGALCVSYSGQCYLSQYLTGRSANRGCCIQACRSRYDLIDKDGTMLLKDKPILSLKDLSLSEHLTDLVQAGISSFKIEGRLKNISYVKNITRYYRSRIDALGYAKSSFGSIEGGFTPHPELTFSRGATTYFLTGKRNRWNSGDTAKSVGEYIGTIEKIANLNSKESRITIRHNSQSIGELNNGDGLLVITPSGETIGTRADIAQGDSATIKKSPKIAIGAAVYRNFNRYFEKELENNMPKRIIIAHVNISISKDKMEIEVEAENGATAKRVATNFEIATNPVKAMENLRAQFEKTSGIYRFDVESIANSIGGDVPFLPLSTINALRRALAEDLERQSTIRSKQSKPHLESSKIIPPRQTTKLNCSNHLSKELYESIGTTPDTAYELSPNPKMELMRTKYCIRHELGICRKGSAEPLYLINQGRKLRASFDCNNCEMVITSI